MFNILQSLRQKDVFITTESPLNNTVEDFWRLVYDYKCAIIILLDELDQVQA